MAPRNSFRGSPPVCVAYSSPGMLVMKNGEDYELNEAVSVAPSSTPSVYLVVPGYATLVI